MPTLLNGGKTGREELSMGWSAILNRQTSGRAIAALSLSIGLHLFGPTSAFAQDQRPTPKSDVFRTPPADVTVPATATIAGTVLDANGAAIRNAAVHVWTPNLDVRRS